MIKPNSGKELLFKIFNKQKVESPAWILYSGMHAGKLLNYDSHDILKDENKLLNSLLEIFRLYRPHGIPILFDLQLEAEILGCELAWNNHSLPVVKTHPLEARKNNFPPLPEPDQGRLPVVLNTTHKLKQQIGSDIFIYGLITGPLTLAFHLRGMLVFMDLFDDESYFQKLLDYCINVCNKMADYYIRAGADVIGVVDPLISQFAPNMFGKYLAPKLESLFSYVRSQGCYTSLLVCGDTSEKIEEMVKAKPDCISIDGTVNISRVKHITDKYNIILSGNIPIINTLIHGSQRDNHKYAIDLLEDMGYDNFILAPGCDLPYNVPRENILGIAQVIRNFEGTKLFVLESELLQASKEKPKRRDKSIIQVDIFALNSDKCSVCYEIINMLSDFSSTHNIKFNIVEHDLSFKKEIVIFKNLKLKNIPTVLVNGVVYYNAAEFKKEKLVSLLSKY